MQCQRRLEMSDQRWRSTRGLLKSELILRVQIGFFFTKKNPIEVWWLRTSSSQRRGPQSVANGPWHSQTHNSRVSVPWCLAQFELCFENGPFWVRIAAKLVRFILKNQDVLVPAKWARSLKENDPCMNISYGIRLMTLRELIPGWELYEKIHIEPNPTQRILDRVQKIR